MYLDDGTVGGSTETVLHDVHHLESGPAELGLHLNQSKSELILLKKEEEERRMPNRNFFTSHGAYVNCAIVAMLYTHSIGNQP